MVTVFLLFNIVDRMELAPTDCSHAQLRANKLWMKLARINEFTAYRAEIHFDI